jgi:formate hydrogenlyase subunit 3/multisubunit Na+/H+ antiporter MnhD subunit
MSLLLIAVGILLLGGIAALLTNRSPRLATLSGVVAAVLGCAVGGFAALQHLLSDQSNSDSIRTAWAIPFGSFYVARDNLSSFFLLALFGLSAVAAIYGSGYMWTYRNRKSLGTHWFFFNLLIAAIAFVLIARNGVLFLISWEVMTLSAFFLVTFEYENKSVCDAGWSYLIASHLGVAFLLVLFILLGRGAPNLDFDSFQNAPLQHANLMFVLAVIGFGTKAGFMPLHVWLPEAHPAAPSHVSAVMSGVLIKTGIYGLLRTLTFLGSPPGWWGASLIAIGAISGVLAIAFALAQHDLKRMLAYSSVENIGIITIGIGAGLLGVHYQANGLAVLGFGGALLHVLNHATFKGLLFLCSGSVLHSSGIKDMNRLGGLLKSMPYTGLAFTIGAAAICGLPPLNGFLSEFLIYFGAFQTDTLLGVRTTVPLLIAIAALALIGGLAAACFAKATGIVFLGAPRSEEALHAHESGPLMVTPLVILATLCFLIGIFPFRIMEILQPVLGEVTRLQPYLISDTLRETRQSLVPILVASASFIFSLAALAILRAGLLSRRSVAKAGTWDCGYADPQARMQYTSSSFSQPLVDIFKMFLRTRRDVNKPAGIFPRAATLATQTPDAFTERLYLPLYHRLENQLLKYRWLQQGRVQFYVLYLALTLLVLLVWKLG